MFYLLKRISVLFLIFHIANIAIADEILTINGPVLTGNNDGFDSSGLLITANEDVILLGFTFNNQGKADTIKLLDSNGNILQTYDYLGGNNQFVASTVWKLMAGGAYPLIAEVSSNGKNTSDFAGLPYPYENPHISVGSSYAFGGPINDQTWLNFTDLITVLAKGDVDADGIPNEVEFDEGTDLEIKDNDIFNDSRLFVMQMYRDFLNREGEAAGIDFWIEKVDSGTFDQIEVVDLFFRSREFSELVAPIVRLYFASFDRIPDYQGLLHNIRLFKEVMTLPEVSEGFVRSQEFINTYGDLSDEEFVTTLYLNVLERAPDADGFQYWFDKLSNNEITRGEMMIGFSESNEYKTKTANDIFVTMMYVGMLRRSPEPVGFDSWLAEIESGMSSLDLIDGFFNSQEYRNRFLPAP